MIAFEPDKKITEILKVNDFTLSAEVIPPRNGANPIELLKQIAKLTESGAQFLAVTKGAGGSLRGGSLPIAQLIKEKYQRPCIAHFTCRDLTPEEVENQLMDHHYFGIRNILGLRGDPPLNDTSWKPRSESHPYAYQLIEQIAKMNRGQYLERQNFQVEKREATDFCIGAAVYPDHPDRAERIEFFKQKVFAGAEFAITQMLFDADSYSEFLDTCARNGIDTPILPGARILQSKAQALKMSARFGFSMPEKFLKLLPDDPKDSENQILDCFNHLIEDLKKAGAPGIHLFVLSDLELSAKALRQLKA
jgi:methylenetetrahydrofolate reductase (NADPH)